MEPRSDFTRRILIPWIFYFSLIALVRFRFDVSLLTWFVGGLLSIGFIIFEYFLHYFWLHPDSEQTSQLKSLVQSRNYMQLLRTVAPRDRRGIRFLGMSFLFLTSWLVLAIFIVSSSASLLAKGLVMGIGLRPVLMLIQQWSHPQEIKAQILWQIKRDLSDTEVKIFASSFLALFGLLSIWLMAS